MKQFALTLQITMGKHFAQLNSAHAPTGVNSLYSNVQEFF